MQEASPKWVEKILPFQDPEPLPKITIRKKDSGNLPESGNSQLDPTHKWGATPISVHTGSASSGAPPICLSSHILGAPQPDSCLGKFSKARQWEKQEGNNCP